MRYVSAACFICLIALLSLASGGNTYAADQETFGRSAALGVNYPGGNLKIFLPDSFAAELRGQYVDKILTGGARLYYYPSVFGFNNARLRPFLGAEGDYISFKGQLSKGNGAAFGAIAGVECFLSKRISVQTDAGPFYIALKDNKSALRQSGLEFVLNFGVNFYFNPNPAVQPGFH
ncbi:MAG: hypothetical protein NTX59_12090 [Elusimicrobia bacterium]|nr:hypothetical protein [Elusimicrobiota bacterium]